MTYIDQETIQHWRRQDEERAQAITVRPGQLWSWQFDYVSKTSRPGLWMTPKVTTASRNDPFAIPSVVALEKDDTFTIVAVDDTGPATPPTWLEGQNCYEEKRYHVALFRDDLIWVEHLWLVKCRLEKDV